jgi:flagellar biosynthesis protein FlhF
LKVKKYKAASMPEAMKVIRAELGNDAVILNSKVIQTGGFLGLFKKRGIEVIAAVDEKPQDTIVPVIKEKPKNLHLSPQYSASEKIIRDDKKNSVHSDQLLKELTELKTLMQHTQREHGNGAIPLPVPLQKLLDKLTLQEIEKEIQEELFKTLLEKWYLTGGKATFSEVSNWAKEILIQSISDLPFGGISFTKKYINVVGPTGVGKTTTLAKIAADCVLKFNKRVAFITTDTYRIAAIEQLKTYATILDVPIEVCYNLDDFQKAQENFKDYDLVFIDTAGRNFRNQRYVEDLKNIIDYKNEMETFLVLSLTAKQIDMEEIYKQFSLIFIDKFIFTKADETATFGAMYNMIHQTKKAAAYITNGQNVPDDFIAATPENVVSRIIGVD